MLPSKTDRILQNRSAVYGRREPMQSTVGMTGAEITTLRSVDNSFTFTLKDGAKVLEINSVKELKEVPKIKDDDGVTYTMIDFEKLSESYDAIEVNISSDHNLYFSLYGWDCDSILIMNPDIIQVGGV